MELDPYGLVITDSSLMTTWLGVFAAGEGAAAALMMRQYLKKVG